jgi:hypothetical protein
MVKFVNETTGTLTSSAKAVFVLATTFAVFLVREAYSFIVSSVIEEQIFGVLLIGLAVAVMFIAILPLESVPKFLIPLQKAIELGESDLTPSDIAELNQLVSFVEEFLTKYGVSLSQLLVAMKDNEDFIKLLNEEKAKMVSKP